MFARGLLLLCLINFSWCILAKSHPRDTEQRTNNDTQCQLPQGPSVCARTNGIPGVPGVPGSPGPPGTSSLTLTDAQQLKHSIREEFQQTIEREIKNKTREEVEQINAPCTLGVTKDSPARSCHQIHQCNPKAPSQSYWLATEEGQTTTIRPVHCNMDSWHCGSKGWTRIAYINMTEDGATCPFGMRQITSPKNLCARTTSGGASCSSVTFPAHRMKYNKVCGQAIGYQRGSPDGCHGPKDINSYYVDGMSITYGSPRKHIWTYAVGLSDDQNYNGNYNCPCAKYPGPAPPSFVGDHYYCESGITGTFDISQIYDDDPLWDGEGCGTGNNCCAQPGMPWFCRTLPQEVKGDIEVRLCADQDTNDEDVYLELLEIYLQ